jgi:DNA-binding MarR family transcriptional regulator
MPMSSEDAPNSNQPDGQAMIAEILALLDKFSDRFDPADSEEWQWIAARSLNPLVTEVMQDATIMMLRVITAIGTLEPVNGITIATQFRIPKGTVSKVTRKLMQRNLVLTETLPQNKKEVYFRLTSLGREVYEVHAAFDQQMARGFTRFLERYSPAELQLLIRVLGDAIAVSFLTLGSQTSSPPGGSSQ